MLKDFIAYQLAADFYRACRALRLPEHLHSQLMRASASVALNLAEGSCKLSSGDQRRFFATAWGSLRECEAILDLENLETEEMKRLRIRLSVALFRLCKNREGQTMEIKLPKRQSRGKI